MDMLTVPISGADWDHLVDTGELDGPYELVGGRKIHQVTENSAHAGVIMMLEAALRAVLPVRMQVRGGHPIALGTYDRPEPDIAVVTAKDDYYFSGHPEPSEVHLLVEASVSSLVFDLVDKAQRYALAGVPEYWVVDVEAREVVVHLEPVEEEGVWRTVTRIPFGQPIIPIALGEPITLP